MEYRRVFFNILSLNLLERNRFKVSPAWSKNVSKPQSQNIQFKQKNFDTPYIFTKYYKNSFLTYISSGDFATTICSQQQLPHSAPTFSRRLLYGDTGLSRRHSFFNKHLLISSYVLKVNNHGKTGIDPKTLNGD